MIEKTSSLHKKGLLMRYCFFIVLFTVYSCFGSHFEHKKDDLLKKLYSLGVFKKGDFTLKSGQKSSLYIDLRGVISCPDILIQLGDCLWGLIEKEQFDVLCGVPYAALPIATTISIIHNKPMIIKRKEAKNYGTKRLIEGIFCKGDRCLIIEDVITTGGSILETIASLKEEGLNVTDIAVCIDREQSGVALLKQQGYRVHVLYSLHEIMNALVSF